MIEYAKAHLGQGIEPWTAGDGTTQYVYKFSRIDWGANLRVLSK